MFKGLKAYLGAAIVLLGGVAEGLGQIGLNIPFLSALPQTLLALGLGLGIIGVRDKQERDNPRT